MPFALDFLRRLIEHRVSFEHSTLSFELRPIAPSTILHALCAQLDTLYLTTLDPLLYPNVANAGGIQNPGVKGEVVVFYFEPLTTQNLKSSGVFDVLGRSSKSEAQRVINTAK
jgi:hypothetical protein